MRDAYICLCDQKIPADEFENSYMRMFKNESQLFSDSEFNILNDLFFDVDSYCSNLDLKDNDDIDEEELLARAKNALVALTT
ncbi:colicin immunity domain-containing protein [Paracoccus wurundjeri]|uniref:colicin immunity domain-containing protein n=1 Tax=Paracoccus onubensis TaxID=1675788 RepID=UPI00351D4813